MEKVNHSSFSGRSFVQLYRLLSILVAWDKLEQFRQELKEFEGIHFPSKKLRIFFDWEKLTQLGENTRRECGNELSELENNKKVSDFLCKNCLENFEQKASKNKFKNKVLASEYYTLIERLDSKDWTSVYTVI